MAHEITNTDHLVLNARPAWHGLGTVVEKAPSPQEALRLARLDWQVQLHKLNYLTDLAPGTQRLVPVEHRAVVRHNADGSTATLGVVGPEYTVIQNSVLAELAEQFNRDGVVKVESAGSLNGGARVWFLLKGETIEARPGDETHPYILLSNAHDGSAALTASGTTVRVVCSNTLAMALGSSRKIAFRHTSGIASRVEEIARVSREFVAGRDLRMEQMRALAAKQLTREEVENFFMGVYIRTLGLQLPTAAEAAAKGGRVQAARTKAEERIGRWAQIATLEWDVRGSGRTAWAAMNAVTEEMGERESRSEKAAELFGGAAERREAVLQAALALV